MVRENIRKGNIIESSQKNSRIIKEKFLISDLHIHSRFARATSKDINIDNLEKYARIKGIDILGTGDFTHPKWLVELRDNLTEDNTGILKTKSGQRFILQSEFSFIYKDEKLRKVHAVVLAPDFKTVHRIIETMSKYGRMDYDGRPIFKISLKEFTRIIKNISDLIEIIPAHIWTPWFGVLGSKSGFDSIEEAFKEESNKIYALETGLSSDPLMNYRLSKLDRFNLVSFSDAHSYWPWRLGREATLFNEVKTYEELIKAIRTGDKLIGTIEVDPRYGKYHLDGHRECNVRLTPQESRKLGNICPVCKKLLTIGVENRVEELADREFGFIKENAKQFFRIIPLSELIALSIGKSINSKSVWNIYNNITKEYSEFDILLKLDENELKKIVDDKLGELIIMNRLGNIEVDPGYDGVYGKPILDIKKTALEKLNMKEKKQKSLYDF